MIGGLYADAHPSQTDGQHSRDSRYGYDRLYCDTHDRLVKKEYFVYRLLCIYFIYFLFNM